MKTSPFLFLIFLFLISIACGESNEENPITYPYSISFSSLEQGSIRMYTANGEVKDQSLILKHLLSKKKKEENPFFLYQDGLPFFVSGGSFTFLSADEILLPTTEPADTIFEKLWKVKETDGMLYWEAKDTLSFFPQMLSILSYSPVEIFHELRSADTPSSLLKFSPLYSEKIAVPSSTGFDYCTKYVPCFYPKQAQDRVVLPYIISLHTLLNGEFSFFSIAQNELNEDYLSHIADGDTLVFQERNYFLKK